MASGWRPKKDNGNNGANGSGSNDKHRKRKPEDLVAATSNYQQQRPRINTYDKVMNGPCTHHPNSKHVTKDFFIYKQFAEQYVSQLNKPYDGEVGPSGQKKDDGDASQGAFQDPRTELNHIFGGPLAYESKRKQKLADREINAVQLEVPQYMCWSEIAINFDRSYHSNRVVHPGQYPRY